METTSDITHTGKEDKLFGILQEKLDAEQKGTLESYNRKAVLCSLVNRENVILTSMAAGIDKTDDKNPVDMTYTRIQCLTLLYFIDREMGEIAGLTFFNFHPCKYGAFDEDVFISIEKLVKQNFIKERGEGSNKYYELTERGYQIGRGFLTRMSSEFSEYFRESANWVKSQNFDAIVWTSYSMYPEMKTEASEYKEKDIGFERQCEFVLDRILHRRRNLFKNFGYNDD